MPIEIRELNIRVNVNDEGGNENIANSASSEGNSDAQQAIIDAVVEKVLDILKEKNER